jgi:ATP-binding cassette subfamily F protein uup
MPRLGSTVIKTHNAAFSYPNGREILHDLNLDLGPGDRVGIVGPNGAGKSTLLDLLAGQLDPSKGTVKHGTTVVTSYFEQDSGEINLDLTIQELVAGPHGSPGSPSDLALMKGFWFTGSLPRSRAGDLSGGERRRLQLLLALSVRPNVVFLDEPTNDLDLETIRLIEDFLSQWGGTLVVASHDRAFLSRTTDRLLEVQADGTVVDFPGGIDGWIARAAGIDTSVAATDVSPPDSSSKTGTGMGSISKQLRETKKEITRLERRRETLSKKIVASEDPEVQRAYGVELKTVHQELAEAEDKWLLLSE